MPASFAQRPRLQEGTLLGGRFRIVNLLGEGAMGAVYEVEHELTKHRRALKLLHPHVRTRHDAVARFLREASVAGRIGDPRIVEIYDAGAIDTGEPYLVMELLRGESLGQRLAREGRLPIPELARIVREACRGVAAAHVAGIVHRDLKPDNMFLARGELDRPAVKLLDFGISKFDTGRTGAPSVTDEGATIGTPLYMAPEQLMGARDVDARADVYALGVILYEAACGSRPFEAADLLELAVRVQRDELVPLSARLPDVPPAFAAVVARAMARDREARFSSAAALADALAPFERAPRAAPRIAVAAVAVTLVVALGAAFGWRGCERAAARHELAPTGDVLSRAPSPS